MLAVTIPTMFKTLTIACVLAAAAGCKTDSPTPTPGSADLAPTAQGEPKGRSGRIDLGRRRPGLPSDDGSGSVDRRDRRDDGGPIADGRKARIAALDTNGDGDVSKEERAAGRKLRAEEMRTRLDVDGDGKVTVAEISSSQFRRFDPETVDANKDGDVSVDELAAALESRGRAWGAGRLRRGRGADGSPGSAGSAAPVPE